MESAYSTYFRFIRDGISELMDAEENEPDSIRAYDNEQIKKEITKM